MDFNGQLWCGPGSEPKPSPGATMGADASAAPAGRVLIVEDELFVAWHLETLAREFGLDVIGLVPDGEGAVEQSADSTPDLVFMDINLAGQIDGVEAARRIRERHDVPMIFITAFVDAPTMGRIEKAAPGAQVLTKPVSADRLSRAITKALSARQS